jgi:hypothetical protein
MIKPVEPEDEFSVVDALNVTLRELADDYNHQPNPDIGGFTPDMLFRLHRTEWNDPDCSLTFNTELPLTAFSGAPFFVSMRNMLIQGLNNGGFSKTANGYLTRASVAELMDIFLSEEDIDEFFRYSKVMNESDVMPIWRARIVLELAGMLRKRKGRFVVPKTKAPLLKEEAAGELAALLFTAHFRRYNLGHMTRFPDGLEMIQHDAGYVLFTIGRQLRSRTPVIGLPEKLLHPNTLAQLEEIIEDVYFSRLDLLLNHFLLRPFESWGLLEYHAPKDDILREKLKVRVTPFYDQWIRFEQPG